MLEFLDLPLELREQIHASCHPASTIEMRVKRGIIGRLIVPELVRRRLAEVFKARMMHDDGYYTYLTIRPGKGYARHRNGYWIQDYPATVVLLYVPDDGYPEVPYAMLPRSLSAA